MQWGRAAPEAAPAVVAYFVHVRGFWDGRDERQTDESVPRYDVAFHKIVKNHSTSLNNRPPHDCNQPDCGHSDHTVIQINKQWHNERSLPLCAGKSLHLIHLPPPVSRSSIPVLFMFVLQHPHVSCKRNDWISLQPVWRAAERISSSRSEFLHS